jgi:GT2 family glycosyltransferase
MIDIVSATRLSATQFRNRSALGLSLLRLAHDGGFKQNVAFENRTSLPEIYNRSIRSDSDNDIVVFIHDDVWIDDSFLVDRVIEGLAKYDVIGVAGNRRRVPRQPSWIFVDERGTWDEKHNLSGRIGHGSRPFGALDIFGPVPESCELLDGVFMATRKSTLTEKKCFFDPRFDFHLYDVDFCRTAREKGLRLGTWAISLTHQSAGRCGSQEWVKNYLKYLDKWTD